MPHIDLPVGVPGIRGAMQFRPETALHLNALAEELLRADNTLSRGDRELIAAYVSTNLQLTLVFLFIVVLLYVRPQGLFGAQATSRV